MPTKRAFVTVDVFTDKAFCGNPLAVVLDADGLSSAQMQAIAGEFNLSETTFVLPPKDATSTAHVRIFTPRAEMPFAGHPNVGTAFALAHAGESYGKRVRGDGVAFEEKAGLVRLEFLKRQGSVVGARLAAPQKLALGETIVPAVVAQACGLSIDDIEISRHAPRVASCGAGFVMVELKSREALARAKPDAAAFARDVSVERATGIHLYISDAAPEIHCRMFAPLHGVHEDPATGSAAVALVGLLAALDPRADLVLSKIFIQGVDMGRPSRLEASAQKSAGDVTATFVGGVCVPVMRGTIEGD